MLARLISTICLLYSSLLLADECSIFSRQIGDPEYYDENVDAVRLCRSGYVLSHNNERKTPDWVLERLTADRFYGNADRNTLGNPFAADTQLCDDNGENCTGAALDDYKGSGYDRGHMSPAADNKRSDEEMTQSFLLSNMAPQIGLGFNRGIWARLEDRVRDWTCDHKELIVITGPIYKKKRPDKAGTVLVPDEFYKIVLDYKREMAMGFVFPNEELSTKGKKIDDVLEDHLESIEEISNLTGINFAPKSKKKLKLLFSRTTKEVWPIYEGCES